MSNDSIKTPYRVAAQERFLDIGYLTNMCLYLDSLKLAPLSKKIFCFNLICLSYKTRKKKNYLGKARHVYLYSTYNTQWKFKVLYISSK